MREGWVWVGRGYIEDALRTCGEERRALRTHALHPSARRRQRCTSQNVCAVQAVLGAAMQGPLIACPAHPAVPHQRAIWRHLSDPPCLPGCAPSACHLVPHQQPTARYCPKACWGAATPPKPACTVSQSWRPASARVAGATHPAGSTACGLDASMPALKLPQPAAAQAATIRTASHLG